VNHKYVGWQDYLAFCICSQCKRLLALKEASSSSHVHYRRIGHIGHVLPALSTIGLHFLNCQASSIALPQSRHKFQSDGILVCGHVNDHAALGSIWWSYPNVWPTTGNQHIGRYHKVQAQGNLLYWAYPERYGSRLRQPSHDVVQLDGHWWWHSCIAHVGPNPHGGYGPRTGIRYPFNLQGVRDAYW
jgi:hypothetical protein